MMRRLVILLGWILAVSAGLLGAAFALAQTRFAKDQIARAAESWLAEEGRRAELVGLSGLLPFSVRVGELRLADGDGAWLEVRGAEVNLDPTALLRGRLVVRSARAEQLRIARRPEPAPAPRPRPPGRGMDMWWAGPPPMAEELVVESLVLEEPVLGTALALRLEGRTRRLEEGGLAFALSMVRTDGGAGELRLEGRWEGDAGRLTASAQGRLDRDLAQTLLRAPAAGALVFSAQLAGPLDQLRGEARIEAEDLFAVEAAGSGSLDPGGAGFRTDVRIVLADGGVKPGWMRVLGQEARASLGFAWRREGGWTVDPLRLEGAGLVAEGSIARGPGARMPAGRLEIRLPDLEVLAGEPGVPLSGSLRLRARGEEEAGWRWELEGEGVRIGRIRVPGLEGSGRVERAAGSAGGIPDVLVSGVVRAARLEEAGLSAPELALALRLRPGKPVALERLLLAAPELRATLTGSVDPLARAGSGRVRLEIPDPPGWLSALGRPVPDWLGIGAVEGEGVWTLEGGGRLSGELALSGRSLRLGPEGPGASEGSFTLRAAWMRSREQLAVSEFTLEGAAVRARGELAYRFGEPRLRARADWEVPDLAALLGAEAAGALRGWLALDGPIRDLGLQIGAEASALAVAGAAAEEARLDARLRLHEGRASGRFTLVARQGDANITLEGGAAFGPSELKVEEVRIGGSGIEGRLAGLFDRRRGLGTGSLRLMVDDLGKLAPFFDRPMRGALSLEASAEGVDSAQSLDFALEVRDLALPSGSLEEGELSGRIADLFARAEAGVRLEMRGIAAPELAVDRLSATLTGEGGRYRLSGEVRGRRTQPFALEAGGALELASDRQLLRLERLEGVLEGQRLRLRRPATAVLRGGLLDVDVIDLEIGEGELQGGLRLRESDLALALRGRDLPLALLTGNALAPARADLVLEMEGGPAALGGRIDLVLREARAGSEEAVARLRGLVEDGMLDLELRIAGGRAERPLIGALRLPLVLAGRPPFLRVDPSTPLSGRLRGMVDLARLGFLLPHDRLMVEGLAEVDLDIAGDGSRPRLRGALAWREGRVEDAQSGVVIRDAEARLQASGSRLELVELRARDAGDGRLRARGWVELEGWLPDRYWVEVAGRDFIVLNAPRGWLVAEGEVVFEGAAAGARLAGSVRIQRGELWLGRGRGATPPALAVLERDGDGGLRPIDAPAQSGKRRTPLPELALDLRLDAAQRLYLRGAGLESEWGGSLRIRGRAREPEVEGALKVRRGRLDFLGQRFAVEQGEILLAGGLPPRIDVDLVARAERAGIQARVELRGPIDRPELVLASDPALPRDEILARLLFGESAQRLDAAQGVRLAAALQALELDRFTEVLDRLKAFVQMDTLAIREGEGGAGIAAGKYLNDQVFVEVEQEFGDRPTKVRVEVEITPSLSLNSEVDTEGEGEVELEWRFDY